MKNITIHKADSRGHAQHGWLDAHHTFSFADYYHEERIHFGVLRVLNDDCIAGGMGFNTHPHDNMEIITIPLSGDLEHRDSMGNTSVIRQGDVQVMSAGTGIFHSEKNHNRDQEVKLLQIWIFPDTKNVTPRYGQISLNLLDRKNKWQQIISPDQTGEGLWIHQNAWFYMSNLEAGCELEYQLKGKDNGIYIFIIEGSVLVNEQLLEKRDGMGLEGIEKVHFQAQNKVEILLMEVPMR